MYKTLLNVDDAEVLIGLIIDHHNTNKALF